MIAIISNTVDKYEVRLNLPDQQYDILNGEEIIEAVCLWLATRKEMEENND